MRPLLFAYPLAMVFTVPYCAVHYFVDVLAGFALAAMAVLTAQALAVRAASRPAPHAREIAQGA